MSYSFTAEPAQSHEEHHVPQPLLGHDAQYNLHIHEGQRHDRVPLLQQNTGNMAGSDNVEITTTQRMISATWGSVLTTLLGALNRSMNGMLSC
jgi:hypothetical protein